METISRRKEGQSKIFRLKDLEYQNGTMCVDDVDERPFWNISSLIQEDGTFPKGWCMSKDRIEYMIYSDGEFPGSVDIRPRRDPNLRKLTWDEYCRLGKPEAIQSTSTKLEEYVAVN